MKDCLFCKIIKGEVSANKIYENDKVVVFLDINPVNLGHNLVVSKEHYKDFLSAPDEVLKEMIITMKKIAKAMTGALDLEGFNIEQNNGSVAGQVIPHLHFHIIPRYKDDGLRHWQGKKYKEGEIKKVAEKIKNYL